MDYIRMACCFDMEHMGGFAVSNVCYIFDLDGTLTPSRQPITVQFGKFFSKFAENNETYIVTGSDYPKVVEQLGTEICEKIKRIYCCSGNDVWENGVNIRKNSWNPDADLRKYLDDWLHASKYPVRTGNHLEMRSGSVNFSIVGRNADNKQRKEYAKWDHNTKERDSIAFNINRLFHDVVAVCGGETGIDIFPKGNDKSQILKDFAKDQTIWFYGDKTKPGGNDYAIANVLKHPHRVFAVDSWHDTHALLKNI